MQLNHTWVSDVPCFKLNERYYYVCVILDLYSRMVIAYKTSEKNSTQLIIGTCKLVYNQRIPLSGLISHSDCGSQYTSNRFQKLLLEYSLHSPFPIPESPMTMQQRNLSLLCSKRRNFTAKSIVQKRN